MAATLNGLRVGLYTRISDDTEADAKGVKRQEQDERAEVVRQGGTVAGLYEENDTSAYKKKRVTQTDPQGNSYSVYRVIRPVYQRLLADLRAGLIDAAIVYDLDRLARDPRDLEDAIEVVQHFRRPVVGVTGGVDLLTDNGRAMARVMVAMANKSSADTARRVKRKHRENAENGIPVGGTRPFGWQDDKRTLHAEEASLVREAAERVLAGAPLSAVVTDWNDRGIRTPRKGKGGQRNPWTPKALGGVLTNPRVCGLSARRVEGQPNSKPEVVRKDGAPVVGQWEPILTVQEWEALCSRLAPKTSRPGGNAHRYLLSGLLHCGKCGAPMRGLPRPRKDGTSTYAYQCHSRSLGGCGGVSILGPEVDELVTAALFRQYERSRPQAAPVTTWDGEADLERAERQVGELHAAYRSGDLDAADYFAMRREVSDEVKRLRSERAAVLAEHAAAAAAPDDLREVWDRYSLTEKRAALDAVFVAVEVKPLPEPVPVLDAEGQPVLSRHGKPRRSRPRDEQGRLLGSSVEDRVTPVLRQPAT
jgi:site-specific DNA recombinase